MWRFLDFLFPLRVDEKLLRETSLDQFLGLLSPRRVPTTVPDTVALFPYSDIRVRSAIHEAKYRGNQHAFTLLAAALRDYLRDADDIRFPAIIVPVPLGPRRHMEREFNQVEEIAQRAVTGLDDERHVALDDDILIRTRETASQVSLSREKREENMRGAFKATEKLSPARTYIVLDDVLTTGATLQAAIEAMRKAGAKNIIPLALAH